MTILENVNNVINELKINSPEELEKINHILGIINLTLEALNDEEKLLLYNDFDIAINLVNRNVKSFGIIDLNKSIYDIKNVLYLKLRLGLSDLTLSDDQRRAIEYFKERLNDVRGSILKRINEQHDEIDDQVLDNLEEFSRLFSSNGKKEYTYDMLEAVFQVVDYDSLTYEDIRDLGVSLNKIDKDTGDTFNNNLGRVRT